MGKFRRYAVYNFGNAFGVIGELAKWWVTCKSALPKELSDCIQKKMDNIDAERARLEKEIISYIDQYEYCIKKYPEKQCQRFLDAIIKAIQASLDNIGKINGSLNCNCNLVPRDNQCCSVMWRWCVTLSSASRLILLMALFERFSRASAYQKYYDYMTLKFQGLAQSMIKQLLAYMEANEPCSTSNYNTR